MQSNRVNINILKRWIDHDELISFMKALGYTSCDAGICYGFAAAGIPSLLLEDWQRFNTRLKWMTWIYDQVIERGCAEDTPDFSADIRLKIQHLTQSSFLSDKDREITAEIPAFCEAMEMHFQPEYYAEWFEKDNIPVTQDINKTLPLMAPDQLRNASGESRIVSSELFTGVYNQYELQALFKQLRVVLDSKKTFVALLLCNVSHAMVVGYCPKKKIWLHLDVCEMPVREIHSEKDIAHKVDYYFSDNFTTVFSTKIYGLNKRGVDAVYASWKRSSSWRAIHAITPKKINLQDWNEAGWLHVAAQNGDLGPVDRIVELGRDIAGFFARKTYDGKTALAFALEEGQSIVVEKLLEAGAELNEEKGMHPLHLAVQKRNTALAQILLLHVSNQEACYENMTPLYRAIWLDDAAMVRVLLQHGADVHKQGYQAVSPLHNAVLRRSREVVKILLEYAAQVTMGDIKEANKSGSYSMLWQLRKIYSLQQALRYSADSQYDSVRLAAIQRIHRIALNCNNTVLRRELKTIKWLDDLKSKMDAYWPVNQRQQNTINLLQSQLYKAYEKFTKGVGLSDEAILQQQMEHLLTPRQLARSNIFFNKRKYAVNLPESVMQRIKKPKLA